MIRYVVFGGDMYYPSGGWEDYRTNGASQDEMIGYARGYISAESLRWAQVTEIDTENLRESRVVWRGYSTGKRKGESLEIVEEYDGSYYGDGVVK